MKNRIAKSDRKPEPLTPSQKAEHKRKYNHKNRAKISRRNKIRYWERIHLLPELWSRWDVPLLQKQLCPQCREYKNEGQFNWSYSRICIMCRKPDLPPLSDTRLVYPKK